MTGLADWETEGARARPATASDQVPVPASLRAVTWTGVLLLVAAVFVFVSAATLGLRQDESGTDLLVRTAVLVVIGVGAAVVGAVALLLRVVAGVVVRR
ncbi:hypothetical protein [Curtobacterium oceanosedimentum]|uniref:hypothetical protein n=1 Tax=Curtobacterium oceanosedimentum TaxID=465820 RepID=UPI001CE173F3|nr:hypothetical protein [Curtobacterium oceanosedimentum]MCA5924176.1 hypothetical protein [Curtobacterium oceanosedimentum]